MKVKDCMCKEVICIQPEASVCECAKLMKEHHIGCIPVCNAQNQVVGLITDRDVLLRSVACDKDAQTTPVKDVMTCEVCTCHSEAEVQEAQQMMQNNKVRRIPVIENNHIIGMLTLGDLAANEQVQNQQVSETLENICKDKQQNAE